MHLLGKYLLIKKNKMKKFIIVAIYLLMGINGMQSQSIPVFKEGERVAFVGNYNLWRTLSFLYMVVLYDPFPESTH